jgi:hypothetical protein
VRNYRTEFLRKTRIGTSSDTPACAIPCLATAALTQEGVSFNRAVSPSIGLQVSRRVRFVEAVPSVDFKWVSEHNCNTR